MFSGIPLFSQVQSISGIVNTYYKVSQVYADSIKMEPGSDLSGLQPGDKVVLIQMTGVNVSDGSGFETGNLTYTNFGNAGHFEMLALSSVNDALDQVTASVTLEPSKYSVGEKIQLVKIFEADYAVVDGELTVPAWDSDTGGVLALVIFKKLTLNSNINVSAKGFRGGDPEPDYDMGCRPAYMPDTFYFSSSLSGRAGRKGEGNIKASFNYPTGPGRLVTGGGGGLGYFAGGGGGSHYGVGGLGGRQKEGCAEGLYASGGLALTSGILFYGFNRVTMGGGGGSSTEDATYSATGGGNGGGIVILLVDTLEGNGNNIYNNGESVSSTAQAGGGGGGAGGSILLDVNVYSGNLNLWVRGGKGGDTGEQNTGAGGGGGGGIIWHADMALPGNVTPSYSGGSRGLGYYNGGNGSSGGIVDTLKLPLNGFLFNSLVAPDTICAGMKPDVIRGSMPKGGSAGYTYTWLQSTDSVSWSSALGTGDSLLFYPAELVQTTYYTRVVESGVVSDTARVIKIYVHDSIEGNFLAIRDTLCYNTSPGTLTGGALSGGNGTYGYTWQSSTNQITWNNRATTPSFDEGNLQQSTYYRRISTSARVCIDTSNIDTLTVIPLIENNNFARVDTAICSGLSAGTVKADLPIGGDNTYRYEWWVSNNDIDFSVIGGATNQNYAPGILIDDRYYKRVVKSGADDVCTDTSVSFYIEVYPSITNNTIATDSTRYCAGDTPLVFTGLSPGGGDGSDYEYTWQMRELYEMWSDISGETAINYTPTTQYEDTVQIRRVVESGRFSACIDSSNTIQIDVIPYIINELISSDSAICEGAAPLPFNEQVATGGAGIGSYGYLWESRLVSGGSWESAVGINNLPAYASGELSLSTQFRRIVTSQICANNSVPVTITVFPAIGNNLITGGLIQYTCYNSSKLLNGSTPTGGDPEATTRFIWEKSLEDLIWESADGTYTDQNYTSPALTDSLFFRRIVLSGEYDQCMDTTDAVLVRINSLPSGDIISGIDTACADDNITVQYTDLQGSAPWSIVIGEDNPVHTEDGISSSSGEISFPVHESGQLRILDLIDNNTCHADLSSNIGVIDLTVFEVPDANAGVDTQVCDLNYTLAAVPSVGNGFWTSDAAVFADETDPASQVTSDYYGTNWFVWTETNWICTDNDEVEVIFYEQPEVPDLGEDITLDYTFEYQLDAPVPLGEGVWEFVRGEGDFEDSTSHNTLVTFPFPNTGEYELLWTVTNGICPSVSDAIIITIGEPYFDQGFSPNGDGVHDEFIINLSGLVESTLIIFDRWGNEVITISGTERIIWNGETGNDREVPEGTYFYILTQENVPGGIQGYIELRK